MSRRFRIRLGFATLPVVVASVLTVVISLQVGDLRSFESIVHLQNANEYSMFFPIDNSFEFKREFLESGSNDRFEVVTIGSSRMQFFNRNFFDLGPHEFYNAWVAGSNLFEIQKFIESIEPRKLPKILIWGLEHQYFNTEVVQDIRNTFRPHELVGIALRRNATAFLRGDITPEQIISNRNEPSSLTSLGVRSLASGNGYLGDGSMYYREVFVLPLTTDLESKFLRSGDFATSSLDIVKEILDYLTQNDVHIIGVLMPLQPTPFNVAASSSSGYDFIDTTVTELSNIFHQYSNAEFFDLLTDVENSISDHDFIDTVHLIEYGSLKIFHYLLENSHFGLSDYSSVEYVNNGLSAPFSLSDVFGLHSELLEASPD